MAMVRITYWRDIPVLVTARDAAGESTVPLSPRFQELVDAVAILQGLADSEAYLAAWHAGPAEDHSGPAEPAARAVAAALEARFEAVRRHALRS